MQHFLQFHIKTKNKCKDDSLRPQGLDCSIYAGGHKTLLHAKHISCRPHGFRENDLKTFSQSKSMETLDPCVRASLDLRGLISRIDVVDH